MCEGSKKISFGFSKLSKPKVAIISNNKELKKDEDVQFIDCVEDKSIKVKNEGPKKPEYLVIPLPKHSNSTVKNRDLLDRILNNCDATVKTEEKDDKTSASHVSNNQINTKLESLEEIATREIIEDLNKVKSENEELNNFSVPLTTNAPLGETESTLDDYESIPVDKFGLAMLRGMGWAPGKGIGKNEKVVDAKQPILRPKGLGLGADKVLKKEPSGGSSQPILLVKGSFVRVIAGAHKDLFGEVIGFDDETGRLIVKMTLGGEIVTFNEFMVQVITKEDFTKNSRVINVKKFEEYKSKENNKGVIENQTSGVVKKFKSKHREHSASHDQSPEERRDRIPKSNHERARYYSTSSVDSEIEEQKQKSKSNRSTHSSKHETNRHYSISSKDSKNQKSNRSLSTLKPKHKRKHYSSMSSEDSEVEKHNLSKSNARSKSKHCYSASEGSEIKKQEQKFYSSKSISRPKNKSKHCYSTSSEDSEIEERQQKCTSSNSTSRSKYKSKRHYSTSSCDSESGKPIQKSYSTKYSSRDKSNSPVRNSSLKSDKLHHRSSSKKHKSKNKKSKY